MPSTINKQKPLKTDGPTEMEIIEKMYGKNFSNTRIDKNLGKYLKEKGYPSLGKLLGI